MVAIRSDFFPSTRVDLRPESPVASPANRDGSPASRQGLFETGFSPLGYRAPANGGPTQTGFTEDASGTEPQWELDTQLALLSQDVYAFQVGGETVTDTPWRPLSASELDAAGIDLAALDDPESGFRAGIYTDGEGHYVVAFAGTIEMADWQNNVQQGAGLDSEQYDQAIALAQDAAQAFGDGNIVFTGHSLGGGLASAAALVVEESAAVTFNAAGLHPSTVDGLGLADVDRDSADGRIRRYNVENEVLTGVQEDVPGTSTLLFDAVGYEITLENPGGAFEIPFTSHGMETVLAAMEARDVKNTEGGGVVDAVLEENTVLLGGHSVNDVLQTVGGFFGGLFGGSGDDPGLPPVTGTTTTTTPTATVVEQAPTGAQDDSDITVTATPPNTTTTVPAASLPQG